jgi:MerR family regulatory protein
MAALTIQDAARRSGLSEPTLRYYEEVGLIGPIARDPSSGHRRYREEEVDTLQVLSSERGEHRGSKTLAGEGTTALARKLGKVNCLSACQTGSSP